MKPTVHQFIETWRSRGDEKSDTQQFWTDLLQRVYGVEHTETFIHFEQRVKLKNVSFIDASIPSTHVLIEQKSSDVDLLKPIHQSDGSDLTPFQQAERYNNRLPYSQRCRWIIVCNFREFHVHNMETPDAPPVVLKLENLENEAHVLNFMVDETQTEAYRETQLSISAGELVGKLYDALLAQYRDPTSPETLRSLNVLCVRLVFCFYAEDAGILGKHNCVCAYLSKRKNDLRRALIDLFRILNQKPEERDPYLDEDLLAFPYVNGGLFEGDVEIPRITTGIADLLTRDCSRDFDWSGISPTIFGAVFESTLNPETRRSGGMHYTSIENIHRVIDPLFLDDLRTELKEIFAIPIEKTREKRLKEFHARLASLTFFDPACGSGNFLTETYVSIRRLENDIFRALINGQMQMSESAIQVGIDQFYGIEINDFAVSVARTALWIAESQMLQETEGIVNRTLDFLPLRTHANIVEGNALRLDWETVVPKDRLSFIMGNPPFVGYSLQSPEQKEEILSIYVDEKGKPYKTAGKIDYVSAWYFKAAQMISGTPIRVAFVSTNSITQGEQVASVWKPLFERFGIQIDFAWRTFRWDSEAKILAHVHCVIVGFSCGDSYGDDASCVVNKYGDDASSVVKKYGDDASNIVKKYGDDASSVVKKHGDDASNIVKKYGDDASSVVKKPAINPDDAGSVVPVRVRRTSNDAGSVVPVIVPVRYHDRYFNPDMPIDKTQGNLPHWDQTEKLQFVTFRLADSLPQERVREWSDERERWLATHPKPWDEETEKQYYQDFEQKIDKWLDKGYGSCVLSSPDLRKIVADAILFFDNQRYIVESFVIMPNHVHVLLEVINGYELGEILHSWKSFTANKINKVLNLTGPFWQKESYDTIIRGLKHFQYISGYIKANADGVPADKVTYYNRYGQKYGDDASSVVKKYGDDVSNIVKKYGDDASSVVKKPAINPDDAGSVVPVRVRRTSNDAGSVVPVRVRHTSNDAGSVVPVRVIFNSDGKKTPAKIINPYLIDAPMVFIESRTKPICDVPEMFAGGKPVEGGFLILTSEEKEELLKKEPQAGQFIRPYMMGKDFIDRKPRFCLWLYRANPSELRKCPQVLNRVEMVRQYRLSSPKKATQEKAEVPSQFVEIRFSSTDYVAIPRVSSELRRYIPMEYLNAAVIPGDMLCVLPDASLYHFGVLTSLVHMAWMRAVCGRLEMRYRYSNTIVYNNFPWPNYGDDASSVVKKYGDDASSIVKKYGDDASSVVKNTVIDSDDAGSVVPVNTSPDDAGSVVPVNTSPDDAGNVVPVNTSPDDAGSVVPVNRIAQTAQGILDARALYPDSSLADLYDENTMPAELRNAHKANDQAVLAAYGFPKNITEPEIVAELMKMYEKLTIERR